MCMCVFKVLYVYDTHIQGVICVCVYLYKYVCMCLCMYACVFLYISMYVCAISTVRCGYLASHGPIRDHSIYLFVCVCVCVCVCV